MLKPEFGSQIEAPADEDVELATVKPTLGDRAETGLLSQSCGSHCSCK